MDSQRIPDAFIDVQYIPNTMNHRLALRSNSQLGVETLTNFKPTTTAFNRVNGFSKDFFTKHSLATFLRDLEALLDESVPDQLQNILLRNQGQSRLYFKPHGYTPTANTNLPFATNTAGTTNVPMRSAAEKFATSQGANQSQSVVSRPIVQPMPDVAPSPPDNRALTSLEARLTAEMTSLRDELAKGKTEIQQLHSQFNQALHGTTFETRLLRALEAQIQTTRASALSRQAVEEYRAGHSQLIEAMSAFGLLLKRTPGAGPHLLIEQYAQHLAKVEAAVKPSGHLNDVGHTPSEVRIVQAISLLLQDQEVKRNQDSWAFLQVPYSPAKDLEALAILYGAEVEAEGDVHPAAKFARAYGYEFFYPTVGTRPDYRSVDVEGEKNIPSVVRGTIAEVVVPGIRGHESDKVLRKAQVVLAL